MGGGRLLDVAGVPDFTLGGPLAEAVLSDELTAQAHEDFEGTAAEYSS
jgi:hypothetical protein